MQLQTTGKLASNGVKILVYGHSGAGKTSLIPTLPAPIILSAEGGLLSIADSDLPFISISSIDELRAAYNWLVSPEADRFQSVALDSISEIAEVVLSNEKKINKDGRAAYGELNAIMTDVIRLFRDTPKHVYMSAKLDKVTDDTARILYGPSMPGKTLTNGLAYHFDEMFAYRVEKDSEGKTQRFLQTQSDGIWSAKDRSGKLDGYMAPDLGKIIERIKG